MKSECLLLSKIEIDLDWKKWLAYLVVKVDLDLGNYERFLDIKLTRDNNITTGKIYQASGLNFTFRCIYYTFLAGKKQRSLEVADTLLLMLVVPFFLLNCRLLLTKKEGEIIWEKLCRFFCSWIYRLHCLVAYQTLSMHSSSSLCIFAKTAGCPSHHRCHSRVDWTRGNDTSWRTAWSSWYLCHWIGRNYR